MSAIRPMPRLFDVIGWRRVRAGRRVLYAVFVTSISLGLSLGCEKEQPLPPGEPTAQDRAFGSGARHSLPAQEDTGGRADSTPHKSTGNPDRDFLRAMSDHHRNLILITHAAIESNNDPAIEADIRRIEEEHDHELDSLLSLLRRMFSDSYNPQTAPELQFTAEMLRKPGENYRFLFFQAAVKNEEQAIRILDAYLPRAKNPEIKAFAERMRHSEPQELAALKRRMLKNGR